MFSRYEGRGSSLKGVDSIVSFQALKGSSGCLSIVLGRFHANDTKLGSPPHKKARA